MSITYPHIDKDLNEIIEELRAHGIEAEPLVPVPYFSAGIPCGEPDELGDDAHETIELPIDLIKDGGCMYAIMARGDSMTGANIQEGDRLTILAGQKPQSGDIVLASVDGRYTIKGFFIDEDDSCWLIPQNNKYRAFQLKDDMNAQIKGVVVGVQHQNPRVDYKDCLKQIRLAREEQPQEVTSKNLKLALKEIRPIIKNNRQWFAVYRVLADRHIIEEEDYAGFINLLEKEMEEEAPTLNAEDLRRMSVQSFSKHVSQWDADDAPVQTKRFHDYLAIARSFQQMLK